MSQALVPPGLGGAVVDGVWSVIWFLMLLACVCAGGFIDVVAFS